MAGEHPEARAEPDRGRQGPGTFKDAGWAGTASAEPARIVRGISAWHQQRRSCKGQGSAAARGPPCPIRSSLNSLQGQWQPPLPGGSGAAA